MGHHQTMEEFLTVGDVVRRWKKADATVRRHAKDGTKFPNAIPPATPQDPWQIPVADVVKEYGPEPGAKKLAEEEIKTVEKEKRDLELELLAREIRVKELEAIVQGMKNEMVQATARIEELKETKEMAAALTNLTAFMAGIESSRPSIAVESESTVKKRGFFSRFKSEPTPS